ncbi:hypothetical protein EQH57_0825 [Dictyocoela roeselum]|nr:hypothetical protein EQH57_0825 [Dictyocoela roeselum]
MATLNLPTAIGNICFVTFPIIGFIPQLTKRKIEFASILSLLVITSSLFRILFCQARDFPMALLVQSVFLLVFHFILIYMNKNKLTTFEEKIYSSRPSVRLLEKFGMFYCAIFYAIGLCFSVLLASILFGSLVFKACGPLAAVFECSIGLVQYMICKTVPEKDVLFQQVVYKIPYELYLCWAIGDSLKFIWMIVIHTPRVFTIPLFFQVIFDFVLLTLK